ncbi:MAG: hypothetical protein JRK53_02235 [Deltaproteobacteria bacterium]|nr:hypothetical protein [Deltaproteobacteria bacterium]
MQIETEDFQGGQGVGSWNETENGLVMVKPTFASGQIFRRKKFEIFFVLAKYLTYPAHKASKNRVDVHRKMWTCTFFCARNDRGVIENRSAKVKFYVNFGVTEE